MQSVAPGTCPCDVFGGEHLVRLLVKLPELVPVAHMSPAHILALEARLHELMGMMCELKNQGKFFSTAEEYKPNPHAPSVTLVPLGGAAMAAIPVG